MSRHGVIITCSYYHEYGHNRKGLSKLKSGIAPQVRAPEEVHVVAQVYVADEEVVLDQQEVFVVIQVDATHKEVALDHEEAQVINHVSYDTTFVLMLYYSDYKLTNDCFMCFLYSRLPLELLYMLQRMDGAEKATFKSGVQCGYT